MTPAARVSAAVEVLDNWLAGAALEPALTSWARASRYAGSKDRAAVRDLVYQAVRCKLSYAHLGGSVSGRGLMLGHLRASGVPVETIFTGDRFAPGPPAGDEALEPALDDAPEHVRLDWPAWAMDALAAEPRDRSAILAAMQTRAPVFLRVNLLKASVNDAIEALAAEGIEVEAHPLSETALRVETNPRRIGQSNAYQVGLVELQDAASQAVVDMAEVGRDVRVLDYCAGGGGKALALAAKSGAPVDAHDIDPGRMRDLPLRAARAGAEIRVFSDGPKAEDRYDVVFCDAPCSGSGSWRRDPVGKWQLTPDRLAELTETQVSVLNNARRHLAPGGTLFYATCSLFACENSEVVARFLSDAGDMSLVSERQFTPLDGGDGFYGARLVLNR